MAHYVEGQSFCSNYLDGTCGFDCDEISICGDSSISSHSEHYIGDSFGWDLDKENIPTKEIKVKIEHPALPSKINYKGYSFCINRRDLVTGGIRKGSYRCMHRSVKRPATLIIKVRFNFIKRCSTTTFDFKFVSYFVFQVLPNEKIEYCDAKVHTCDSPFDGEQTTKNASNILVLHDEAKAMAEVMCTKDISKSGKFIGETVHRELLVKYAGEPIILMEAKSIQSYVNKFRSEQFGNWESSIRIFSFEHCF